MTGRQGTGFPGWPAGGGRGVPGRRAGAAWRL